MEYRSLKFIDKFQRFFTYLGVDYPTMRKILELKLTMDSRRIPTALQNSSTNKQDNDGNKMLHSLWMYTLFSLMPGVMAFIPISIFSKISIIMGISMFLIMSTMISDFSSVLLDIRDKNILMAFPVNSKTMSAAKVVHITIYLFLIAASLNLLPVIGIGYTEGIGYAFLLILMIIFMVMMVIFLTSLMYVLVLNQFDGERLKDLISSIQIMLTIVMTLGYQVVVRMFEFSGAVITFTPKWWTILLIPTWFAAPFALISGDFNVIYIILALLGVIMPIVCIILHFKVITPMFEANLIKLNTSDSVASKSYFANQFRMQVLSKLVCKTKDEQAAFQFGYNILSTERELKQKVYPSLAMSIVFPFILSVTLVKDSGSIFEAIDAFRNSNQFLWIYFSVMIMPSLFLFVSHSKYYKGAWIFKSLPIEDPYILLSGTFKSAIMKFGVLPFIITATFMTMLAGVKVIPHMGIAFINTIYMVLFLTRINGIHLPFSIGFQVSQDGHMKGSILGFLITGGLGGLHLLLVNLNQPYVTIGVLILLMLLLVPMWKYTLKISWEKIKA